VALERQLGHRGAPQAPPEAKEKKKLAAGAAGGYVENAETSRFLL